MVHTRMKGEEGGTEEMTLTGLDMASTSLPVIFRLALVATV